MSRRTILVVLIAASCAAFAARAGLVLASHAWRSPNAVEYRTVAMSLVHGTGFSYGDWGYYGPSSVQAPPFPAMLAGLFEVFGHQTPADGSPHGANAAYLAVMLINALGGAALVWLVYGASRSIHAPPAAALVAAVLVAIWPSQVYAARLVQEIVLVTCGLLAMQILFFRAVRDGGDDRGSRAAWIGYCIVACITTLLQPVFLPALLLTALLAVVWPGLSAGARLQKLAVMVGAMVVLIGPWTVRNCIVHGQFVPIRTTFWADVWKGNNDYATGSDRIKLTPQMQRRLAHGSSATLERLESQGQLLMLDPSQQSMLKHQPEIVRENVFKQFALKWIEAHPHRYLQLCGIRLAKTLTIDWDNPKSYNKAYMATRYLLLALTLGGLLVALWQRWSLVFPMVLYGSALLYYALTLTNGPYSVPFEPIQLCFAAALLALPLERWLAGRQPRGFEVRSTVRRQPPTSPNGASPRAGSTQVSPAVTR